MTSRPWARLLPGAVFLTYLVATALLFFVGPWRFPVDHGEKLVVFLAAVHLAFAAGYLVGLRGPGRPSRWRLDVRRAATFCLLVDVVLLFPTSAFNTGHWVPDPWAALDRLGDAYLESLRLRADAVPWVNYLRILVAPLLAAAWPLGVVYWQRLGIAGRLLLLGSVVGTLALYTAMGANMGAAHWMALFPWFVVAGALSGALRLDGRGWTGAAAVGLASVALFGLFFAATMNHRHGSFAKHGHLPGIEADLRREAPAEATGSAAAAEEATGSAAAAEGATGSAGAAEGATGSAGATEAAPAVIAARGLAGYLTHGYYAVYLSLDEPFVSGRGVGHSVFLQRQAARLTGDPSFLERSYPQRIEARGWNAYTYWATIYPWIASDVTFPGTVVVVFFIGWAFAAVWKDVLTGANPWAVAFFGQLLLMLYYFPAHNRTMHSGEGVVAFTVLGGLWWLGRRRRPVG